MGDDPKLYLQGSLDGHCGIYSVCNAINLMVHGLNVAELFSKIIKKIGPRLSRMTLNGMTDDELKTYVLDITKDYLKEHGLELSYVTLECQNLDDYWKSIKGHYEEHGAGSIVIGTVGVIEHWTCVKRVTDKTIEFADSGRLKKFYRAFVTVGEPTKRRRHVLSPSETFLLSIVR